MIIFKKILSFLNLCSINFSKLINKRKKKKEKRRTLKKIFEEIKSQLFNLKERNPNLRLKTEENEFFASLEERHGSESKPLELRMKLEKQNIKVCLLGNDFTEDEFLDYEKAFELFIKIEKTLFKD